jgi:chaperonin GroEL (HSP60 family)
LIAHRAVQVSMMEERHRPLPAEQALLRTALPHVSSVASLLITTEAMIAEKPKKESAHALPAGAGMDF